MLNKNSVRLVKREHYDKNSFKTQVLTNLFKLLTAKTEINTKNNAQ